MPIMADPDTDDSAPESPLVEHARGLVISAGIGVGIVLLVTLEQSGRFSLRVSAYRPLMGAPACVFGAGGAWSLRDWLHRTRAPRLARAATYAVAGMASWVFASWLADAVGLVHI